jgi:ParB-like chromosome segregation protein Spo0J
MTMGGGEASFVDGRHRFAVLRDLGLKTIPVTVAKEEATAFRRKYGAKRR